MRIILIFAALITSILVMGAKISVSEPMANTPSAVDGKKI